MAARRVPGKAMTTAFGHGLPAPDEHNGGPRAAPITVLVAAGREATRTAITSVLDAAPGIRAVGVAADVSGTNSMLRRSPPDVVLVDWSLLGDIGLGRLSTFAALAPSTAFVVIGMGDHPGFAARARAAGAADYVRLDDSAERVAAGVSAAGAGACSG
jgi:two-component system, NarL family, uhpT operon response regulator UhpA